MFGYVRPWKPELRIDYFELYKSVYCALCERLGRDYGFTSRFILSYDAVFLAVAASIFSERKAEIRITEKCCVCNPLKKCKYCRINSDALEIAAAFSVISFYYKLSDTQRDESFFKAFAARIVKRIFLKKKNKAADMYPRFDKIVSDMIDLQFEVEKNPDCSVDRAADPTAKMLAEVMRTFQVSDPENEEYARFGYFLGRWIYLVDMIDDFVKDKKSGSFNPLVLKFGGDSELTLKNPEIREYCGRLLKQTMKNIFCSYRSVCTQDSVFKPVADNIVFDGLFNMSELVLNEENKRKKYKF